MNPRRKKRKCLEEVIITFKYFRESGSFEKSFLIDGFIEKDLPKLKENLNRQYVKNSKFEKNAHVYEMNILDDSHPEPAIRLFAKYAAAYDMIDAKYKLIHELKQQIEKEKQLVKENHFNSLEPVEVLDYMRQLTQLNPKNDQPYLSEKEIYELTNMICLGGKSPNSVTLNITRQQKKYIRLFFYGFYRYSKDNIAAKDTQQKYVDLLKSTVSQFHDSKLDTNHFGRKCNEMPIRIDPKFRRWEKKN